MDFKLISENWKKFLNEDQARIDPGPSGGGVGPLTWSEVKRECMRTWTGERIQACYFNSVRGLPSVAQIIKMVSKDKDILAALGAVESGDIDVEFSYTRGDGEVDVRGTKHTETDRETSTGRVITIYLDPSYITRDHRDARVALGAVEAAIEEWNEHLKPQMRGYYFKEYGSESLDYWVQGAIRRDRLDNFVNLWGFTMLLKHALILVHELAHAFDPDSMLNLLSNREEFSRVFSAHTESDPDRENRAFRFIRGLKKFLKSDWENKTDRKKAEKAKQAWQQFLDSSSGRAEMFATNRTKDFIANLENSELLKLAYSATAGGPTNVSASGVNLEKFSLVSALTPPPTKDNVSHDTRRDPGYLAGRLNSNYNNIISLIEDEKGDSVPHAWVVDQLVNDEKWYSGKCSKKLRMMSKDLQLDFYGVATGESDDRLAPDNYEDRKYITRTTRSSNKKIGLDESKRTIKINII